MNSEHIDLLAKWKKKYGCLCVDHFEHKNTPKKLFKKVFISKFR